MRDVVLEESDSFTPAAVRVGEKGREGATMRRNQMSVMGKGGRKKQRKREAEKFRCHGKRKKKKEQGEGKEKEMGKG